MVPTGQDPPQLYCLQLITCGCGLVLTTVIELGLIASVDDCSGFRVIGISGRADNRASDGLGHGSDGGMDVRERA
jgi:hypothetical protein